MKETDKKLKEETTQELENSCPETINAEPQRFPNMPDNLPVVQETKIIKDTVVATLDSPSKMLEFAETLVKGKMCSFKEPADAMIAMITGQELGIGLAATLSGIYIIEGRPSLGVHLKKAVLLQNNIIFKKIRDYEAYYEFVDFKDKTTTPIVLGYGYLEDLPKYQKLAKHECKKKHVDTKTEYIFTRYFRTMKGIVKNTAIGSFSVSEAQQADLMKKHNWKHYLRDMLSSRAFSRGANEIADDLLNGMLSYSELADINDGVTYYIDENGHEQIVK